MKLVDRFIEVFDVWEEARPYLALLVDEDEMELVVAIAGRAVTAEEAAELLGLGAEETVGRLERAYRRHVVDKRLEGGVATYTAGSLWGRLDHVAKYENWDEIPAPDRKRINRRFLDAFIARHRTSVERKMQGLEAENALPNDTVLLLHEAEEMVDAATHIVVQPCDCRRLGQNCDGPVETCIWFDDGALECLGRGHGRRLTRQEAKDLLRWVDKQGLMHTGDSDWRTRGLHAICNCCACDCYPFLAAQELGSQGVWPKSRYVAVQNRECCTVCGVCVTRCHFGAFTLDGSTVEIDGRALDNVRLDPTRCWGCGLCANTCPADAIAMQRLEAETT
jgi:NAD-dependent dihydropyrimidine dehydrogenase PreA subunit